MPPGIAVIQNSLNGLVLRKILLVIVHPAYISLPDKIIVKKRINVN